MCSQKSIKPLFYIINKRSRKKNCKKRRMCYAINIRLQFYKCSFVSEKSGSDWTLDFDDCVRYGMKYGVSFNFLKIGDPVIVISRWEKSPGFTDSVRIKYVHTFRMHCSLLTIMFL